MAFPEKLGDILPEEMGEVVKCAALACTCVVTGAFPPQVDGDSDHQRVSGSTLGGGTFWGLCRLLTRVRAFDEMLELSAQGDNAKVGPATWPAVQLMEPSTALNRPALSTVTSHRRTMRRASLKACPS